LKRVALIVEGHGDVAAVPVLLRRIAAEVAAVRLTEVPRPIRIPRNRIVKEGEIERAVALARGLTDPGDGILILIDADEDCPAQTGPALLARARACRPERPVSVVLAKMEFEAWFLAAAESLRGVRGLPQDLAAPPDPEGIRDAKGWLGARMPPARRYRETIDQAAMARAFDLAAARRAPSFDKLCRDLDALLRGAPAP
jgi:hypothetical protein